MSEIQQKLMDTNSRYDILGEKLMDRNQELVSASETNTPFLQDMQSTLSWLEGKCKEATPIKEISVKREDVEKQLEEVRVSLCWCCFVYLIIWTINICPLTIIYEVLLNIIGGKGALSNINY